MSAEIEAARTRAHKALNVLQTTEKLQKYGLATVSDIRARRADYQGKLDELARLLDASHHEEDAS